MTNLVKITLRYCNRCEEFPSLGHLPKLREMEISCMNDLRIIGSDVGLASELSKCGAAGKVTTMCPSLTKLSLYKLPNLEEWLEPDTSRVSVDRSSVQVFPKLEVLEIDLGSNLTRMPKLELLNLISKNNCQSLKDLKLDNCPGLTSLTVGVALEKLILFNCPDLTSVKAVEEEMCCLKYLYIRRCPYLSEISQSVISTIQELGIDKNSGALSSSVISFPNLTDLTLYGDDEPTLEFDDGFISSFSALTCLMIDSFKGLKAIPETVAQLSSLERLSIWFCEDLESLSTFHQSHTIRCPEIMGCGMLKERCEKGSGPEWYKIQHILTVSFPW